MRTPTFKAIEPNYRKSVLDITLQNLAHVAARQDA